MRRANLLVAGSAIAMLGWGTILPYQYAYAAETRGWGGLIAAAAASLFSVGALVAAPLGGRLADRYPPVVVAVTAKVVAALAVASLIFAETPAMFLLGMLGFGFGIAAANPAQSVLVLRWVPSLDRRRIFAWQFSGQALGMGAGAFIAGYVVDLDRADGMWPAFAAAGIGFVLSATLIAIAGRGVNDLTTPDLGTADLDQRPLAAAKLVLSSPALRWAALVTVALALGFYAQFESGLPAYALTVLTVSERTVGTAAAVNSLVIIILQMAVVKWTAKRSAPGLLMAVGSIWVLCWLILAAASHAPELAAVMFVTTFGIFAVGETMYAPVLNPLIANLAPSGYVGTTLGLFGALQTGVSAAGPLVAGVALSAGWNNGFVGAHVVISAIAVLAAWRLQRLLVSNPEIETASVEEARRAVPSDGLPDVRRELG